METKQNVCSIPNLRDLKKKSCYSSYNFSGSKHVYFLLDMTHSPPTPFGDAKSLCFDNILVANQMTLLVERS